MSTCGSFWKSAATTRSGMFCCDGVERLQHVAAHVEIDLAGEQQRPPADLRAALHDRHVEAAGGIGAVGDRLVVAAMLGLGEPVGAEGDLFVRRRAKRAGGKQRDRAAEIFSFPFIDTTLCLLRRVMRRARHHWFKKQDTCHRPGAPACSRDSRLRRPDAVMLSGRHRAYFLDACPQSRRRHAPHLEGLTGPALGWPQTGDCHVQIPHAEVDQAALRPLQPRRRGAAPASGWCCAPASLASAPDDQIPEDAGAQAELCFAEHRGDPRRGRAWACRTSCASTPMSPTAPICGPIWTSATGCLPSPAPASTLMIVSGFARPEFKVEIEVDRGRVIDRPHAAPR